MKKEKRIRAILICTLVVGALMILSGTFLSGKQNTTTAEKEKREKDLSSFLEKSASIENASVKLCLSEEGRVTGAAVVCSRGNDALVQKEVVGLLTVLLDVGAHEIYVSGG